MRKGRSATSGICALALALSGGLASAPAAPTANSSAKASGAFSRIKKGRLKVQRKLTVTFSCGVTCSIVSSFKLIRPGGDFGFGKPVHFDHVPVTRYAQEILEIPRHSLDRLKTDYGKSRLRVSARVTDSDTGATEHLEKFIRFKRPPRPKRGNGGGGGGNCTPGYSPCIPPGSDVDCAGGSGNGPRYVQGPIRVTGSDPYGLDRDGDGVGCD